MKKLSLQHFSKSRMGFTPRVWTPAPVFKGGDVLVRRSNWYVALVFLFVIGFVIGCLSIATRIDNAGKARDVDQLVEFIQSEEVSIPDKRKAIRWLGRYSGNAAAVQVLVALNPRNRGLTFEVVKALGKHTNSVDAFERLQSHAQKQDNADVRAEAFIQISLTTAVENDQVIETLKTSQEDSEAAVVITGSRLLRERNDFSGGKKVYEILQKTSYSPVKKLALKELQHHKSKDYLPLISEEVNSTDPKIRKYARVYLKNIGLSGEEISKLSSDRRDLLNQIVALEKTVTDLEARMRSMQENQSSHTNSGTATESQQSGTNQLASIATECAKKLAAVKACEMLTWPASTVCTKTAESQFSLCPISP